MLREFREFAMRGNVLDLAIGVIIGAAFTAIVNSLVNDVIMPPLSLLAGRADFSNRFVNLTGGEYETLAEAREVGEVVIAYGLFLNALVQFLIIAFVVFLLVRQVNRLKREPDTVPTTRECPYCLSVVPLRATRCPHCTSQIGAASATPTPGG